MADDARSLQIKQSRKFWMRWRVRLGYPLALACFYLAKPTPGTLLIGTLIALIGLAIRALAECGRNVLPGLHSLWSVAKRRLYGCDAIPPRKVY